MADLQELFARLNGQGSTGNQAFNHQQASVSSPVFSPSPNGPQPHHQSAIMSPNTSSANTPAPDQGGAPQQTPQQQSAQLLNLLRFNSQPGATSARRASQQTQASEGTQAQAHARTTSASDSVANLTSNKSPQAPAPAAAAASSENPQDLLLRLLNHPKPSQADSPAPPVSFNMPETAVDDLAQDFADAQLEKVPSDPTVRASPAPPMRIFGSEQPESSQSEINTPSKSTPFTYVNPFEKLEAASPRNRTPAPEAPKQKIEILKHAHAGSTASGSDGQDLHKDKARKMSPQPHETVAEAVNDLGEQMDQQVEEALAQAEGESVAQVVKEVERVSAEDVKEVERVLKDVASEAEVADSWDSAETEDQTVIVYKFPMKAFASITVKDMPTRNIFFPSDLVMDIARLKKDFDQIDRSLVSASKNFIVYALPKKGGFKIIRQENGEHRQVFENHSERHFNIALCASTDESRESILGIGVNGTVFWTSLEPSREDQFGEYLDSQGIMLPPSPQDDNTSGGQLKTRAKPSSRHPDFFAVGRGKSIHIVFPRVAAQYLRPRSRICHTEKYFKERSLKILTGKAGKDFSFSEDDTVIVSLDKAGRMRFWDIRSLTSPEVDSPPPVDQTLLEFHTTSPNEKSWPTSVFFLDKDKPFTKGIALRYVMVGMKQNHAFQLWDLGLGKAVQEINLPHEKESDAICSVAYHPRTGIMAVAHPTRNSIFLVHVSCPRYNLPVLSQAQFIERLANKGDKAGGQLPPVTATAIMTSISEYSFSSKGQIRSLHMLTEPAGPSDVEDSPDAALFELYVMHSKGVCTIRLRRSEIGWKSDGELLNAKQAEEEGIISSSQLKPAQPAADESSTGGDTPAPKSTSDRSARESIKKESSNASRQSMTPEAAMRASTLAKVESKQDAARAAIINGSEKSEKKKKKRSAAETGSQASSAPRAPPPSYAQAAQTTPKSKSPAQPAPSTEATSSKVVDVETPEWAKKLIDQHVQMPTSSTPLASMSESDSAKLEHMIQTEVSKAFSKELETLYKRIEEDKRIMNAQNGAKQEAILRLVSSTLNDNVEGVIRKMVNENMRNVLLPDLLAQTSSTLEMSINNNLNNVLGHHIAKEVPESVSRALKSPQLFQSLSEQIANKIKGSIESSVAAPMSSILTPAIANLSNLIEHQIGGQLRQAEAQRQSDVTKVGQLMETVQTCLHTIQSMAATQAELQAQVGRLQQFISQSSTQTTRSSPQATRSPARQKSAEELEMEAITRLMDEGKYEQGTMQWLHSSRPSALFDSVFVRCDPAYLRQVSPLLALSTGAVVTDQLESNLSERLVWLEAVLNSVDPMDNEVRDIIPRIMEVMTQRLTATYMKLNESQPGSQLLRRISTLVTKVRALVHAVQSYNQQA